MEIAVECWRKTDTLSAACRTSPIRRGSDDLHVPWAILIVDDNPRFRARARECLESEGHVVVAEAPDGASARAAVSLHRPEVVLLDIRLPDESGISVAEGLAREHDAPAVVLTSTHDPVDFGAKLKLCGARGFVPKAEFSGAALAALLQ